jgi:hypothetical protein
VLWSLSGDFLRLERKKFHLVLVVPLVVSFETYGELSLAIQICTVVQCICELEKLIMVFWISLTYIWVRGELQLFRIREGKYSLDLQQVGGPSFLFLELCSSFLTEVWDQFCTQSLLLFFYFLSSLPLGRLEDCHLI